MCKASLWSKHHEIAKDGSILGIGISDHSLPAFHKLGDDPSDCIQCVKDGTILTLSWIPRKLQRMFRYRFHIYTK